MTRKIYRITGTDTRDFLQGLVTNDVARVDAGPVYAAMLTPQGKYLADFLLVADGDGILLDVDATIAAGFIPRLSMYKLRAEVEIAETDLQVKRGTGPAPEGAVADPRHPDLGWRLYGAEGGDDGSDFDHFRVAHCIPASGIELTPDSYILESGFERLNGVDFKKGCYVGQEVTARMKHKTQLKKGLITVAIDGAAPVGTPITVDGKPAGTLFTQSGGQAIAYLRFDRMREGMQADGATLSPL
ncbi:folate-binding protein [Lutimaribacter sp. EGI FJ00015]|uniref:Folate-binding protein n=1 Tax=Lutimaribacter degradans TaxID=2945989 RepID=A0ACC5ZYA4_9RHOB|nr:folate-binding protein [Lutimaribacter sp. EGI FJ00013]MCM2562334.1 folate-binding protein [Lutimaribacter sp. EGI FJ00013]MCO0613489.1 folate-binding protein [Lutimaribacter sp. EGI FJ00015]MCO0636463.1 folate-binding protein [Lutimaribacter sp. EGI FJ00014]